MHILIIGKNGQVGYELVEACKARNISFDMTGRDELDLTDLTAIRQFFEKQHNYNFVVNAAAYTQVDKAEDEPELADRVNHQAVGVIAEMCQRYDMPLLHISTDYVFDGKKTILYNELDMTSPCGIYGLSKLKGEQQVQKLEKHLILRVSWVFGRHGNNFVKTIARLSKVKEKLAVIADQYGAPTAARDIARVILDIMQHKTHHWGTYHYSSYPLTTWHQLASGILPYVQDSKVKTVEAIETKDYPLKARRPQNSGLSCNKILNDYQITQHHWLDYIKETVEASSNI
ncbi:dTDP-4-dehydrorhamnose reductase [Fangia hongkongensis]|uniref:dTDP-4-dehydrorhamnose reductase n=1 Tax=Fangia hongkongensis TaxID=270495 RepID=UPI00037CE53C|nr:dTDP-4-dehydrorhamnose reductase [Fangia hongkongensis]MBK2125898.1 dTDP-4-dehydrorhamnose reductase [Fangia hongkongensis]